MSEDKPIPRDEAGTRKILDYLKGNELDGANRYALQNAERERSGYSVGVTQRAFA